MRIGYVIVFLLGLAACAEPDTTEVHTESGLVYTVVDSGVGPEARQGDRVTIHESTSRTDGLLIFSTWKSGGPLSFTLGGGQVVQGMDELVTGMRVGERRHAVMPPAITRRQQYPDSFGPEDTLEFDVLLLEITAPDEGGPRQR